MILEKQTESNVLQEGQTNETIGMSLDLDSAQILMQMLSKNLYSDSIGSTVRECASNALDSHRRAGVEKPIIVSFGSNSEDNYEFSVEDFGVGLDADDVRNIISKYGKSTKRNSNTELGMMGLGFKAPLAYSSSFYFVCRKDGMERKYMMYEGEDVNTIDLLYEAPTTECNGVKVIIPVKWNDRNDFTYKIKEQLAYFENVYFNVNGIDNSFNIFRGEDYQFSELASNNYLHVCLDNVYYPLDFEKLGIEQIKVPVGLRFSLTDGLFPTPNRESLRYTQEAKTIILAKIGKIANHLVNEYNKTVIDTDDVNLLIKHFTNNDRYVNTVEKTTFNVKGLESYSSTPIKNPVLKNVKLLSSYRLYQVREYLLMNYEINTSLYRDKYSAQKGYWGNTVKWNNVDTTKYYIYTGAFTGNKKLYMKSFLNSHQDTKYFIKNTGKIPLMGRLNSYDNYYTILELGKFPKNQWRDVIKEFQYVASFYTKQFNNLDDIQISKQWLDARRKTPLKVNSDGKRQVKLEGEVIAKEATALHNYSETKNCKFVSATYDLKDFYKRKDLYVYTSHENAAKLDPLFGIFTKQYVKFITFSPRELGVIEKIKIHNLISLEEFMKGNTKPFKRTITAYLINTLIQEYKNVFTKSPAIIKGFSIKLSEKLRILEEYSNKNHQRHLNANLYESMLVIAQEQNLFDIPMYNLYLDVKKDLERLYFLKPICDIAPLYRDNDDLHKALADLCKYHKYKVNINFYNSKSISLT